MTTTNLGVPGEESLAHLSDRFRSSLSLLRARVRFGLAIEGLAFVLLAFAGYFIVTFVFDRWFRLEIPVRAFLLATWLAWVVWQLLRRVLQPMAVDLGDDELALALERSDGALGQRLISALQFHRRLSRGEWNGDSPALMGELLRDTPQMLDTLHVADALKRERTRKSWLLLLGCGVFLGCTASLYGGFGLWAKRNLFLSSQDWPRETMLRVVGAEDSTLVVPRGDDFTVEVDADGVVPESVRIEYEFADGSSGRESMTQNVGEARFTYTFAGLMDPVTFYAWGGDGETPEIEVRLVDRPALASHTIDLRYPKYMRREARGVPDDATEVVVPRGTAVHVKGRATKELERAELAVGENEVAPAKVSEDRLGVEGSIRPKASGLLYVRMLDTDGLHEGEGRRLMVRVVPDKAPRLVARTRGIGAWVTHRARIPIDLTATDDFGLQRLELWWGVGESATIGSSEELAKTFQKSEAEGLDKFEPGTLAFERIVRHDLMKFLANYEDPMHEKNPVKPGQFVAVRFKAWDNNLQGGEEGQWATSDSFTFKVVTDADLLRELNRRQTELRVQFEKFVRKEEADRAEFRELADPNSPGALGARIRNRLSSLARQQRALGKRVLEVGRRYAQILDEMVNNRVTEGIGGEGRIRALRAIIVDGLDQLGKSAMPAIARAVASYGRQREASLRPVAEKQYDAVIRQMRRILDEMLRLESFTEVLTKLRGLIRLNDETARETKRRLEKDLEQIFGKDPPKPDKEKGRNPDNDGK